MLVILEGPDFAGKSTIATLVADSLAIRPFAVRRSRACLTGGPVEHMVMAVQEKPYLSSAVKGLAFHLAYMADSVLWRDRQRVITLQESYVHRVAAYSHVRPRRLSLRLLKLIAQAVPKPDLAFYLKCGFDERKKRYMSSGSDDPRDAVRFGADEMLNRRLESVLESICWVQGYQIIDTEHLAPDMVAAQIVSKIDRFLGQYHD